MITFMIDVYNFDLIAFEFSFLCENDVICLRYNWYGIHWIDQMKKDINENDSTMIIIIIISVQCEPG